VLVLVLVVLTVVSSAGVSEVLSVLAVVDFPRQNKQGNWLGYKRRPANAPYNVVLKYSAF
jgi:hypothetical protein